MRRSALALLPLLLLAGCGGGGGDPDPGGGGNPDVSDLAEVRTSAIFAGTAVFVDATNLLFGERAQFRLTGIAEGGARQDVSVTGWRTTVPANVGTITSDGVFAAGGTPGTGAVSVTVEGTTYSGTVTVKGGAIALLTGRVRVVGGNPVSGVGIQALNAAGTVVATGFSTRDGSLRIGLPATATRLNVNFDALDPSASFYVRQYALSGIDYSSVIASCTAPLPRLANNTVTALPSDLVVYALGAGAPPPPPDGCVAP